MKRLIVTALFTGAFSLAVFAEGDVNVTINVANGLTIKNGDVSVFNGDANTNANVDLSNATGFTGTGGGDVNVTVNGGDASTNVNTSSNGSSDSTGGNVKDVSVLVGSLSTEMQTKINDAAQKCETIKESFSSLTPEQVAAAESQLKTAAQTALNTAINEAASSQICNQ